ncbi:MAG: ATP-binding protein [Rhizomicrobium sp.]|jgi:signal transduction histidine kinase/HPt (histidine-containing phosphotransfer) domain-containing protein
MSQVSPPETRAEPDALPDEAVIFAGRIDFLYRLGRFYLFLPFSALCIAAVLYTRVIPPWLAIIPFLLQIASAVVTSRLIGAYLRRAPAGDVVLWARRYVVASACSGAAWGVGAIVWFVPHHFPAEAFLALTFLGMTAAEFIARAVYRPAYLAHASCSLAPLAIMLALQGNMYAALSSVLVLFFGGVLFSYCEEIGAIFDEGLRLRRANVELVERLRRGKRDAELARDLAEASTRAKSAFVANISHEIRTPLNALLGMAQLLERSELDRAQKSHVKVLVEAGHGLKTLLDDVIALSRDEGEPETPVEDDCDPAQAARTVVRLLQARAWEKQLRLSVTTPSSLPRAAADPRKLRQVLLKLADNALKFTQRGGIDITVEEMTARDGKQTLRFSIADTGLGVPPDLAPHIFEPFLAGDNTYTRRQAGAGLGLAVARRVITSLGGDIGFESEPGEGSTFWFTVPAMVSHRTEARESEPIAGDAAPPWGLSVLVWSADENVRAQIAHMLEPFGNRLEFAKTIAETIANAGRSAFDAIIAGADDADIIAAAPGVKAPILALIQSGMRPAAAVDQSVRWPAGPGALYAALRDMLGRAADAGVLIEDATKNPAAIDATAFAALEKSLGLSMLVEILQSYIKTAEELTRHLEAASQAEHWDEATRIAHDIAGSAGGLGLLALTAAARGFAQRVREGSDRAELKEAARYIGAEHRRVCKALANLYPELAAA